MNFTPALSAFQGAIISTDNIHSFSKLIARGGNEEKIVDVVANLFTFLQERQCLTRDGLTEKGKLEMRKFTFYLVLNADLPSLEDMVEMPGIDMVVWTIPTVTKCLLCELVWGLSMDPFLYEIIAFCNPQLSLQVLHPFIDHIKHSKPTDCFNKVKTVAAACYRLACRLHFLNHDSSYMTATSTEVYENLLQCINYFVAPPNAAKLEILSEYAKYKHLGENLYTLVKLVLQCLAHYTSVENFEADGFEDMYMCTFKMENIKDQNVTHKICDIPDGPVSDCLNKCNTALLDKCVALVMEVSVDIFCAWSEIEENGKSMQQIIGETCYLLHANLEKIPNLAEHPIVKMLPQISRKPEDIHDIIRLADNDTIIENVNKGDEHCALWLHSLTLREDLCENVELMECITSKVQYISQEDSLTLLKTLITHLTNSGANEEPIKLLSVKLIGQCELTIRLEIISNHFNNNIFNNMLETTELSTMSTEIFNKLIATPDANVTEVLNVFIQNPFMTYTKILKTAIENSRQCDIMVKVMELLNKYSAHYYITDTQPCVLKSIEKYSQEDLQTDVQRNNFVQFVVKLKAAEILSGAKLLLLIIMPNLHKALLEKDINIISVQTELIDLAFSMEELLQYRAPLLAMLAQVLEVVRWDLKTFHGNAPTVLEQVLQLQIKIFDSYDHNIPEKDLTWLKNKVKKLMPLNMYYYRALWNPPGDNFIEIITGKTFMTVSSLTLFLTKVLFMATPTEWLEIWHSLPHYGSTTELDILYNALSFITRANMNQRSGNTWACLVYCYRNAVIVTKEWYLDDPPTEVQVMTVMSKLIAIVNLLDEGDMEDMITALMPLLSYLSGKNNATEGIAIVSTHKIIHKKFQEVVNKIFFSNGSLMDSE